MGTLTRKGTLIITLALCITIVIFSISTVYASVPPPFKFVTPWVWESSPNLTIESPVNGTYVGRVMLNFTAEKPSYWFNNQSQYWINSAVEQSLKSVTYVLDGNSTTISVDNNLCLPYECSIELTNLTEGTHQLIVYMNSTGVYRSFRGFYVPTQITDSNKTAIFFTFAPAPSPTPLSNQEPFSVMPFAAISVIVVALVVAGLLLFYKYKAKC